MILPPACIKRHCRASHQKGRSQVAVCYLAPGIQRKGLDRTIHRAGNASIVDQEIETVPSEFGKRAVDGSLVAHIAKDRPATIVLKLGVKFLHVEGGDLPAQRPKMPHDSCADKAGTACHNRSFHESSDSCLFSRVKQTVETE